MRFSVIEKEVQFTAVRSRGPGGQNVNKVSSAAQLSWHVLASAGVNPDDKELIFKKLASYINKDGELLLRSDEYRDLPRNKARCLEKLTELLKTALHKPKKRRPTKPTKSAKKKRRETKIHRSELKKTRQKVR